MWKLCLSLQALHSGELKRCKRLEVCSLVGSRRGLSLQHDEMFAGEVLTSNRAMWPRLCIFWMALTAYSAS